MLVTSLPRGDCPCGPWTPSVPTWTLPCPGTWQLACSSCIAMRYASWLPSMQTTQLAPQAPAIRASAAEQPLLRTSTRAPGDGSVVAGQGKDGACDGLVGVQGLQCTHCTQSMLSVDAKTRWQIRACSALQCTPLMALDHHSEPPRPSLLSADSCRKPLQLITRALAQRVCDRLAVRAHPGDVAQRPQRRARPVQLRPQVQAANQQRRQRQRLPFSRIGSGGAAAMLPNSPWARAHCLMIRHSAQSAW